MLQCESKAILLHSLIPIQDSSQRAVFELSGDGACRNKRLSLLLVAPDCEGMS